MAQAPASALAANGIPDIGSFGGGDIASYELYVALAKIACLTDAMRMQLAQVDQANKKMAVQNQLSSSLAQLAALFGGTDASQKIGDLPQPQQDQANALVISITQFCKDNNIPNPVQSDMTLGQVNVGITSAKNVIDTLSSTQQTDMLRLQSLISKQQEASDTATNFMRAVASQKSNVIGNMGR